MLLTPGIPEGGDNYNSTFAAFKADESLVVNDANNLLSIDMENDVNDARRLMCENIGEVLIEWTYEDPNNSGMINWFLQDPNSPINWTPTSTAAWPTALKFTFTLYDSEGIIKKGRRFTHIAYLDD
jgi:hypothetical protein